MGRVDHLVEIPNHPTTSPTPLGTCDYLAMPHRSGVHLAGDPCINWTPEPSPETDPYGNGTLVPSDHWGKGCPADCEVHAEGLEPPPLTLNEIKTNLYAHIDRWQGIAEREKRRADAAEAENAKLRDVVEEAKTVHFVMVRDRTCRCASRLQRPCALAAALDALEAPHD